MDLGTYLRGGFNMHGRITGDNNWLSRQFGCLARALAYIHGNGVMRLDIKPGNILVHAQQLILTDFGAAIDFSESPDGQWAEIIGTIKVSALPLSSVFNRIFHF